LTCSALAPSEMCLWDKKTGHKYNKPNAEWYVKVLQALFANGATKVWAEKHGIASYDSLKSAKTKIALSQSNKGYAQTKPEPVPAAILSALSSKPEPKPEPVISVKAITGEVPQGEVTYVPSGTCRDIYTAVCTMYTLEECRVIALQPMKRKRLEAHGGIAEYLWRREVLAYANEYQARFAHNLFDYLTVASIGEARHAGQPLGLAGKPSGRHAVYKAAHAHDPRELIPKSIEIFTHHLKGGSYGGPKWSKIAQTAAEYFQPMYQKAPTVYADHCVDLAHNGGLAFNKGYIFTMPSGGNTVYFKALDIKRKGSLLQQHEIALKVSAKAYFLLKEAESLGLVPLTARLESVDDPTIPTIKWGMAPLGAKVSLDYAAQAQAEVKEAVATLESYPER